MSSNSPTIGSGSYGIIKKVRRFDMDMVIKQILLETKGDVNTQKKVATKYAKREIKALEVVLGCDNVVQYHGTDDEYNIYMEFVEGVTLKEFIKNKINKATFIDIARQLLHALVSIAERNVTHGDLKPENIIYHDKKLTLIDFGISVVDGEGEWLLTTWWYRGPENNCDNSPIRDPKIDMWSYGVILLQVLYGHVPKIFRRVVEEDQHIMLQKLNEACDDEWTKALFPPSWKHLIDESFDEDDIHNIKMFLINIICDYDVRHTPSEAFANFEEIFLTVIA